MRGYEEYNFPAFHAASKVLREAGWEVWSPAERDEAEGFNPKTDKAHPLAYYMQFDLPAVCGSDAVWLLDGWEDSDGARLEVYTAHYLGIPVLKYPDGDLVKTIPPKAGQPIIDYGEKIRYRDEDTGYEKETSVYRFDLIPPDALAELARVYGTGEQKYPSGPEGPNWMQGGPWWASIAALERHLASFKAGQDIDPTDHTYELAKVAWHSFALLTYYLRGLGVDTRAKIRAA
jgi:hypothetical protein